LIANGYNAATPSIGSFTVQEDFGNNFMVGLGGIGTLSVGGTLSNSDVIANPTSAQSAAGIVGVGIGLGGSSGVGNPVGTAGAIGTVTAGEIQSDLFHAGSIGTVSALGIAANKFGLGSAQLGNISSAEIFASQASTTAAGIGTISTTGNFNSDTVVAAGQLTNFTIAGTDNGSSVQAGFVSGSGGVKTGIVNINVGAINADNSQPDFVTWYITTFNVKGNAAQNLAGSILPSSSGNNFNVINVLGNNASVSGSVGIATFSATGTVQEALFSVFFGNVTSFKTGMFLQSGLIVGVGSYSATSTELDPINAVPSFNGVFSVGSFTTTATYNVNDILDSASFQNSDVVAWNLGTVTLSGVNTNATLTGYASFGLFFEGTSGAVKVNGSLSSLVSSFAAQNIAPQAGSVFFYI